MWRVALAALFVVGLVSAAPYIIIEKRTTISGNGTGNGTSDGNNYTTAISVSGTTTKTLNLARLGMVNLTASWEDLTGAGVETDPVFYGNTSLICWGNGTNCQPDDAYNASYITTETDPLYRGNTTLICFSNGTNCPGTPVNNGGYSNVTQFNSTNRSIIWTSVNSTTLDAVVNLTWAAANCAVITGSAALCDGDDASGGGGGFSANQTLNTSSAVTFSGINITATDAALQFNSSGLRWMIQVQDSGANLKFIDVQGSVILSLNKDSDTTTAKNLIGAASYAGAIPVSAQGAASQTANLLVAESSAGTDYVVINGTGFLNSSIGTFIDAKNCDTVDTDATGRLACGTDASGSAGQWVNVTRTNTTFQGTTLRNISGIGWTVAPFYNYSWGCSMFYRSNATTNGISFSFQVIGGNPVYAVQGATMLTVSTTTVNSGVSTSAGVKVTSSGVQVANTAYQAFLQGYIENGASTVTVWPQFSAETAADNSTILRGSNCEVRIA